MSLGSPLSLWERVGVRGAATCEHYSPHLTSPKGRGIQERNRFGDQLLRNIDRNQT